MFNFRFFDIKIWQRRSACEGSTSINYCLFIWKEKNKIVTNMISVHGSILIFFIICLFHSQGVFSIKCWVCRSDTDPKCSDPFDNSTVPITDCRQMKDLPHLPGIRPTMCRKIRQKVNGEWRYFRSCAYLGEPGIQNDERFCLMRTGTYNIFMEYCTCNSKDGCNVGSTHTKSSTWALASAMVVVLTSAPRIFILR